MKLKLRFVMLTLLAMIAPAAFAQYFTVAPETLNLQPGKTVELSINKLASAGNNAISAFQTTMTLPAGLSIEKAEKGSAIPQGWDVMTSSNSGTVTVMLLELSSYSGVSINDGELLKFTIKCDDSTDKMTGTITFSNSLITSPDGTEQTVTSDGKNPNVNVDVPLSTVTVTAADGKVQLMDLQTVQLTATTAPANANTPINVSWSSNDNDVATVDPDGLVTAHAKVGKAIITATANNGVNEVTGSIEIEVVATLATSVTLNNYSLNMLPGTQQTLTATVAPDNATDKTVNWSSDNEAVATVVDGVVTAVAKGTANIKATCGNVSATCVVTVNSLGGGSGEGGGGGDGDDDGDITITPTPGDNTQDGDDDGGGSGGGDDTPENPGEKTENGAYIKGGNVTMRVGQTANMTLAINPPIDYDPGFKWNLGEGGDQFVKLTVAEGNSLQASFEGLGIGETTYTVTTPMDGAVIVTGKVNVIGENPITTISVTPEQVSMTQNGLSVTLQATITPETPTKSTLSWSSSDEKVAKVSDEGVVSPVGVGECDIIVTTTDGTKLSATSHVTVTSPVDGDFTFDFGEEVVDGDMTKGISLYIGSTTTIEPKAKEGHVLPDDITFSSSDDTTVSVSPKGLVSALQLGSATVTAKATMNNEEVTASVLVTVIPVPASTLTIASLSMENEADKHDLKATETIRFTVTVAPENTTFKKIVWSASEDNLIDFNASNDDATEVEAVVRADVKAENVVITAKVEKTPDVFVTYTVNISDLLLGDANDSGSVNSADVITVRNEIMSQNTTTPSQNAKFSFINADVDLNKAIDAVDQAAIVNIALGKQPFGEKQNGNARVASETEDNLLVDDYNAKNNANIGVDLENAENYVILQADFNLPEGMELLYVAPGPKAAAHEVTFSQGPDNNVRVMVYSMNNTPFGAIDGPLFTIVADAVNATSDLDLSNIIAADTSIGRHELGFIGGKYHDFSGLDGETLGKEVIVYGGQGEVVVVNAAGSNVKLFTTDGKEILSRKADNSTFRMSTGNGLYIVEVSGKAYKVLVK